jgi:hypothetical protein
MRIIGLAFPLVHCFIVVRMEQAQALITSPFSSYPRIFGFIATQVLSLAPGPVTAVRAFLAVDATVSDKPETISIEPFPCNFVVKPIQNHGPDVLALVLSKNSFLTSRGVIITEKQSFCQSWRCNRPSASFPKGWHFQGNWSSIFYQFSVHSTNWAHWICETLAVLVWLPYEMSHNSMIVWTNFSWRPGRFINDGLKLFGFTNNLCLPDGYFLFTQELWTLAGFRFNQPYPEIILEFRRFFVMQLELANIIPSQYFLMQRVHGQNRFLQNMGLIVQAFQLAFSSLPWTVITYFTSVEKSAREFWHANLLFAVHGAGCGSLVFMQVNTIFLELASQSCVPYMWQLTRICGIYHVLYMMPGVKHFGTHEINLNLSVVYVMIAILRVRFGFR